jgi:hypothetical protein
MTPRSIRNRHRSYAYCVTNCVTTPPDMGTAPRTPTDIASTLTCTFLPVPSARLLLRDEEVALLPNQAL